MGRRKNKKVIRRSGFEDRVEKFLNDKKVPYLYEPYTISYTVPERKAKYYPDFEITTKKGNLVIIEAKGIFDPSARNKMALVVAQNPKLDIRMLFQRNNYIRKGSETTYGMWCDKNKIKWAVGGDARIVAQIKLDYWEEKDWEWQKVIGQTLRTEVSDATLSLILKLIKRDELGRKKYGTSLDRTDLTKNEWLTHLQEELLDAAGYCEVAKKATTRQDT